jgi:branched-chain amino acid transport system substrate-binding protein
MTRSKRTSRWLVAMFAAMALVVTACAGGSDDAATNATNGNGAASNAPTTPIVIGGTLGLTGMYSGPSAGYKAAYDYWLEQINKNGGMLGRQVQMKIYDDESNATTAQQLFQKLINDDKVDLLLAPYTTAVGGAVVPITERAGKILFDAGFVSKSLHQKSKLLVSSWPYQEPEYPKPFFEFLKTLPDDQRPKTVAVATEQNPFTLVARDGHDGEGGVLNYAKELGMEVVFSQEYDGKATDLTGLVEAAKASKAEAFVALSLPNGGSLMAKTLQQVGYTPKYYCQCGSQVTTLPSWPDLGEAAVNVMSTTSAWPTQDNEGMKDLYAHMKVALKSDTLPAYAAGAYAILQVMQQSVEGTKSLDQQKLRDYIAKNSFKTSVGDLTYNADGTVKFAALLVQFQKGGNQVVWPDSAKTGDAVTYR